jgi:hypothetical protein
MAHHDLLQVGSAGLMKPRWGGGGTQNLRRALVLHSAGQHPIDRHADRVCSWQEYDRLAILPAMLCSASTWQHRCTTMTQQPYTTHGCNSCWELLGTCFALQVGILYVMYVV